MAEAGPQELAGVREGEVLAGKYCVERILGVGGMGIIVAARHVQLDEKVALKFLRPEALADADAVERFAREARAAVKIKSEHVARVIDVGTLPNGAPYMVMEHLDGEDLAAWLKERGALPVEQALEFVLQACVAVADAHALGIVHRDLKPANLFCIRRSDGQLSIKVLDFGISKLTERTTTAQRMAFTKTTALMGSPLYMSPEQMRSSKDVDAQTDIWALGVILFELMTGRPPFQADSVTELAIKVNSEPTPAIRTLRPDVTNGLEAVVFKCLEKDRRQRYGNVAELALALLPFAPRRAKASVEQISGIIQAAGLSASALAVPRSPPPPTGAMRAARTSTGTLQPLGRTTVGSTRRKTVIGAGLIGAVVLFALGGSLALRKPARAPGEDAQAAAVPTGAGADSPTPSHPGALVLGRQATPAAQPSGWAVASLPSASVPSATEAQPSPTASTSGMSTVAVSPVPSAARANPIVRPTAPMAHPAGGAPERAPPTQGPLPPHAAPSASQTERKTNCNPPYVIDSAGDRQYKPECL